MICINPLSETLHPEKSSFSIIQPAVDYFKFYINYITPSSPKIFLLRFSTRKLQQFIIVTSGFTPSRVKSFPDRLRVCNFYILLSPKLKILSIACKPRSPITFPLRLTYYNAELTAPSKKVQTPSARSSLSQRLIFLIFLLLSSKTM